MGSEKQCGVACKVYIRLLSVEVWRSYTHKTYFGTHTKQKGICEANYRVGVGRLIVKPDSLKMQINLLRSNRGTACVSKCIVSKFAMDHSPPSVHYLGA